jgi:hypothetical protein
MTSSLHPTPNTAVLLQDLDDAASDGDTNFADGADSMAMATVLTITACVLMWMGLCSLITESKIFLIIFLIFQLATCAMIVAAMALVLTTSQLNGDHWKSATACTTDVLWDDGLNCCVASLAFLFTMNVYYFCSPTPAEHRHEPSWFQRRMLTLVSPEE